MSRSDRYEDDDGKQTRPLPRKWMQPSQRFKIGDRIEFLDDHRIHDPCDECRAKEWFHYNGANYDKCGTKNLKGQVGVVLKVNDGCGSFPPTWYPDDSDEGGTWLGEREGWLTVRFPFDSYGFEADGVTPRQRACHPSDEGRRWRKSTERCVEAEVLR